VDFTELMTLEAQGDDTFVARSPRYPWGGIYGGQLAAQALRAAGATVPSRYRPHSLHAYFLRQGSSGQPITLTVERTRDGRSFTTRTVVALQGDEELLTMTAGFHVGETTVDDQAVRMPPVPEPDALPPGGWSPAFDRRFAPTDGVPGRALAWMRCHEQVADDPVLRACALAYLSDDIPTDAVIALLHPERPPANDFESFDHSIRTHSLDYAVWFHRPPNGDGWQLQDFCCRALTDARGLAVGHIFDRAGVHLATIGQEVLVRPPG
jgi:acyl-CoA thioesterase II